MKVPDVVRLVRICLALAVIAGCCQAQQTIRIPAKAKTEELQSRAEKTKSNGCMFLPTRQRCMKAAGYADTDRNTFINDFYGTNENISFFNQIKSIYNSASASAT